MPKNWYSSLLNEGKDITAKQNSHPKCTVFDGGICLWTIRFFLKVLFEGFLGKHLSFFCKSCTNSLAKRCESLTIHATLRFHFGSLKHRTGAPPKLLWESRVVKVNIDQGELWCMFPGLSGDEILASYITGLFHFSHEMRIPSFSPIISIIPVEPIRMTHGMSATAWMFRIAQVCICDPDGHWQSVSEKPTKELGLLEIQVKNTTTVRYVFYMREWNPTQFNTGN